MCTFRYSYCINAQFRVEVQQVIMQTHQKVPSGIMFSPHAITEDDLICESGTSMVKAECFQYLKVKM